MTAEFKPRVMGVQYASDDDPRDIALCGEIGRLLSERYPGWAWGVEIPPQQNVIIIRNLDCDPRGKMGMVTYKDRLTPGLHEVFVAAGEFLERYRMRTTRVGFEHDADRLPGMIYERPQT